MANNPYVNKVQLANGTTLIDLSQDTVTSSDDIVAGKYGHLCTGERVLGTAGGVTPPPSPISSGVKFVDFDGTELYNYNTSDALALTALPTNPSHSGLTAQGWNWSLTDIKAHLTKCPNAILYVGQMYVTDDGKTRVYIHLSEERKSPVLGVCPNGTVDVDWGDGTTHSTLTGTSVSTVKWTSAHTYAHGGDYVIKLTVTGKMGLYGSSTSMAYMGLLRYSSATDNRNPHYIDSIYKVELGSGITGIGSYGFNCAYGLRTITLPHGITSIGTSAFYNNYALKPIVFPDTLTSIGNTAFYNGRTLTNPTLPKGLTTIGNQVFHTCYTISNMIIPDSVTSIGTQAFNNCFGVIEYHVLPTTPPTLSSTNAFTGIADDCIIYVPYSADHSILNTYKTTSNWKTYASYMQEEPQS